MDPSEFLSSLAPRSVAMPKGCAFEPVGLAIGQGNNQLEVLIAKSSSRPNDTNMLACWKARLNRRAIPLLVVVFYGEKVALCGASGE
ncbi:MAG TPA: hypothetical protein VFI27_04965, partial [candidate division Zixibacteria bacterium]|nr:hypothetical protein [candidate division Zixibacteria bacterium]